MSAHWRQVIGESQFLKLMSRVDYGRRGSLNPRSPAAPLRWGRELCPKGLPLTGLITLYLKLIGKPDIELTGPHGINPMTTTLDFPSIEKKTGDFYRLPIEICTKWQNR